MPDLDERSHAGEAQIRAWVLARVAKALQVAEGDVDADASFIALGLDSVVLFSMTGELAEWLDRDLPGALLFEVSSINELVAALAAPDT